MADPDFDASERIAGFSLLSIKHALTMLGVMEDDDVASVAKSLRCPTQQAERVLDELERRGLVAKAEKGKRREKTEKGHRLAYYWSPPRRFTPAIEREPESGGTNEIFESVPCSIWRVTTDQEEMFEEAEIDVGVHVEYENERLIEINVIQPDEYQGESSGSGTTELSVYITAADARRFAAGLQAPVAGAEAEAKRRAVKRARQAEREKMRATKKSSMRTPAPPRRKRSHESDAARLPRSRRARPLQRRRRS